MVHGNYSKSDVLSHDQIEPIIISLDLISRNALSTNYPKVHEFNALYKLPTTSSILVTSLSRQVILSDINKTVIDDVLRVKHTRRYCTTIKFRCYYRYIKVVAESEAVRGLYQIDGKINLSLYPLV
ncbi:hypothetical protein JTB14_026926 [Gonioctena quinquepunctata]|nr:hypothetical protein JTB14_026926 [Gonioctena quinquepunctata]